MPMTGLTIQEIADELGIPYNTARMRLDRLGIEPVFTGNIYSPEALEAVRNVPGKGRPPKKPDPEPPNKPPHKKAPPVVQCSSHKTNSRRRDRMYDFEQNFVNIEVRLPAGLLDVIKSMADVEGRTANQTIVNLLEQAVFINPEDLAMIADKALRKATLAQLAEDENAMVEKYKAITSEIRKAADGLAGLKKE